MAKHHDGLVWTFNTARFCVSLEIEFEDYPKYDGDDEDGETQRKLDSGEFVQFDSRVKVELDGLEIGNDYLGSSVYARATVDEFWTAHRDPNPMNRNCLAMRAVHSEATAICHYFPEMVRTAIRDARAHLRTAPRMREDAPYRVNC